MSTGINMSKTDRKNLELEATMRAAKRIYSKYVNLKHKLISFESDLRPLLIEIQDLKRSIDKKLDEVK